MLLLSDVQCMIHLSGLLLSKYKGYLFLYASQICLLQIIGTCKSTSVDELGNYVVKISNDIIAKPLQFQFQFLFRTAHVMHINIRITHTDIATKI